MDEHAVFRVAVEILVAIVVWVVAATWLLYRADAPEWVTALVALGGGFALGMLVGWLRLGRAAQGGAQPRPLLPLLDIRRKGHLVGAAGAVIMAVVLGVQDEVAAHAWAVIFGVLAVVQVLRALRG